MFLSSRKLLKEKRRTREGEREREKINRTETTKKCDGKDCKHECEFNWISAWIGL